MEELLDGDAQAVTEFFYGGYSGAVISSADDVVYSGLCYAAKCAQFVDRDASFCAESYTPTSYSARTGRRISAGPALSESANARG